MLWSSLRRLVLPLALTGPAVEGAVRLEDWVRFGIPLSSGIVAVDELQMTDESGAHPRPGAAFRGFRINALGFRGPDIPDSALRDRPVVVVSGASESFGLYESPGREWPRQLEDSLQAHCGAPAPVVLNAAFAGMALPTVMQDLSGRVLRRRPRVVVYYPQPMQYLHDSLPRAAPRGPASPEPPPWRSRALPRVRDQVKAAVPAPLLDWLRRRDAETARAAGVVPFATVPADRLDSLESDLRRLVGVIRAGGAAPVLVTPQHRFADTTSVAEQHWLHAWIRFAPKATAPIMLEFAARAQDRVRRVAADSGAGLIDPPFATDHTRATQFADPGHFTDAGAAILAGAAAPTVAAHLACSAVSLRP